MRGENSRSLADGLLSSPRAHTDQFSPMYCITGTITRNMHAMKLYNPSRATWEESFNPSNPGRVKCCSSPAPVKKRPPRPTMIQTAGTCSKNRPYIRGPSAPSNALVLNAKNLPNPYNHTRGATSDTQRIKMAREFLMNSCPHQVDNLVNKGYEAIKAGIPVVIVCVHGQDRSRAIAEMIGELFHCSSVYYVHREA